MQTANLYHDDPERTKSFLSSPGGHALSTDVATFDARVPGADGHPIRIRVYTSDAKEGPLGLVIFFHSGGFTAGSLDTEGGNLISRQVPPSYTKDSVLTWLHWQFHADTWP